MDATLTDLWLWPITVAADEITLVVTETGGASSVSIPAGTYYAYKDADAPAGFSTDYPSLYDALETAVNGWTTGTYELQIVTPGSSSEFASSGLQWVQTAGAQDFGFTINASFTFDPAFLGLGPDSGGRRTPPHVSDFSRKGVWQSPRCRSSAFMSASQVQFANNGSREVKQVRRWRTDRSRLFQYHWIAAGHVHPLANDEQSFADGAQLALGDHGNTLFDLWNEGLSTYQDIIVIHKVLPGDITLGIFDVGAGWEIVSALDATVADDFDSLIKLENRTGAHFGVDIAVASRSLASVADAYPTVSSTYYARGT